MLKWKRVGHTGEASPRGNKTENIGQALLWPVIFAILRSLGLNFGPSELSGISEKGGTIF